jgi:hypothetical protein
MAVVDMAAGDGIAAAAGVPAGAGDPPGVGVQAGGGVPASGAGDPAGVGVQAGGGVPAGVGERAGSGFPAGAGLGARTAALGLPLPALGNKRSLYTLVVALDRGSAKPFNSTAKNPPEAYRHIMAKSAAAGGGAGPCDRAGGIPRSAAGGNSTNSALIQGSAPRCLLERP